MDIILYHPPHRTAEREYVHDLILREFLGLQYSAEPHHAAETTIRVRGDQSRELIISDTLLSCPIEQWLKAASLPKRPLVWWTPEQGVLRKGAGHKTPILFGSPVGRSQAYFSQVGGRARLGLDIFGSAFFMLTRYEEMVSPERDNLDRFPAAAALAVQERFLDRPIVNDYIDILWWALKRCWPALRRKPRNHRVFLSHDVDEVSTLGRSAPSIALSIAADLIKRREPRLAARKARAWIETNVRGTMIDKDPYNTFDFIMRTSEALGLNSTFNVTPGHSHYFDPPYRIQDEWILRLLRQIASRGHEVGYQASYNTHRDSERTCAESELLRRTLSTNGIESDLRGGRQHFLRWANPATWQNWEDAGLEYDTTLTHAEQAGFRCGCCYEYPVWNLERRQRLRLRERPLVAMESSLLSYQKLRLDCAEQALLELTATCRRYDGDFTLLWHNATLVGKEARAVYARVASAAVNGTHHASESDACETQTSTPLQELC